MKTLKAQLEVKNAGVRRDNSQLEEGGARPQLRSGDMRKAHTQDVVYFENLRDAELLRKSFKAKSQHLSI